MGVSDLWERLDQHTILYIFPATVLSDKRDVVRIAVCYCAFCEKCSKLMRIGSKEGRASLAI